MVCWGRSSCGSPDAPEVRVRKELRLEGVFPLCETRLFVCVFLSVSVQLFVSACSCASVVAAWFALCLFPFYSCFALFSPLARLSPVAAVSVSYGGVFSQQAQFHAHNTGPPSP